MILILCLALFFSLPFVQTKLASVAVKTLNKDFNINLTVEKVDLSLLGSVSFKGIKIRDHHQDTLIFVNKLSTSLYNAKKIIDGNVNLGDISLSGTHFYMKTYKGEKDDNMNIFVEAFDDGTPDDPNSSPFILKAKNIYVEDLLYKITDENEPNPLMFAAKDVGGNIQDLAIVGPNVSMKIRGLHLIDDRGINITRFTSDFSYTKKSIKAIKTTIKTNYKSKIKGDIIFNYKRADFAKFTDKVNINATFKRSVISVNDLHKFYKEIKGNDRIFFNGKIKGVLNNFDAKNVYIHSKNGMRFKGDMNFVNSFNTQRGFVFNADIDNVLSNYEQLKNILPNVLGKTIPTKFKNLGDFSTSGIMTVTPEKVEASLTTFSEIGNLISDLKLTNIDDIDNASYNGKMEFINFDLGKMINDSLLGKVSLQADVNGSGFKVNNVSTIIAGKIHKVGFKGYEYKNLDVNGYFQNKKFDGFLKANDENFNLIFEGLADFSSKIRKFDFTADITNINLKKTNLFLRDSIAVLKGNVKMDILGNTLDDVTGKAVFKNLTYTNQKQSYSFKEFKVQSSVKDSIKTITVDSKDIVEGTLKGKFKFKELLPMTQNALGSVYTNYTPIAIDSNQFMNFNFKIYNQIIDIFLPQVSIGKNTQIKGKINSDTDELKLTFSSPQINAYKNVIDSITLRMDNKNKIYNTHLTAHKIKTAYYDISKLNLLNKTMNDTLFFKSTFKGGKNETEKFNLDFFYTINSDKKSVIGIQKSLLNYKNKDWFVNPNSDKNHTVTFDYTKKYDIDIKPFQFISDTQKIDLQGFVHGKDKNIKANFKDVSLQLLPEIENFALAGKLNGNITIFENEKEVSPKGFITINDLVINDFSQGTLTAKVTGNNSLKKYKVDVAVKDYKFDNLKALGTLDFSTPKATMDMLVKFKEYELNGFSDLGDEVFSNLRGNLSGSFTAKGQLLNPYFKGKINLDNAGLTFPYLNIDFDFIKNANIELLGSQFLINNLVLEDTKYNTRGYLSGGIAHKNFEKWALNLDLDTPNLLVLDTKEAEEVPYYGKGFLKGNAQIRGLTSNLIIDVNGSTQPRTLFVIPLNDVTTVSNYKLIRFKTRKDTKTKEDYEIEKIKGLNLKINLDVTKDAVAKVVIDKVSGSDLTGSGRGNLDIEIDTRGKFIMNGDLEIDKGTYNFKYSGIPKTFTVQKGGIISWSGDPMNAELNLVAIYRAVANPAQLLNDITSNRKIPVDLYTRITGGLFDSKQEFDIKIPNADSTIASELEFKFDNNKNSKMLNFASLLLANTFYNDETRADLVSGFTTGTVTDVVSNVFSNVLNKGGKIQVGFGFNQADKTSVEDIKKNDDVVDVSVSTQINNRVIVNGKVGVPVGAKAQTNVVGEVNVEVLLNEKGTLRGKFFNRPNDVQYSLEEEGYTQGVGLSYQVNFNNIKELGKKINPFNQKKSKKKKKTKNKKKELIYFKSRKKDSLKTNEKKNY